MTPDGQHKWVVRQSGDPDSTPYARTATTWACTRCGCEVHCFNKPRRRRDLRKLGVGTNCREELVRNVLES